MDDSRQGTIQICVNNAWGSVCSDYFFDNTDAAVFCGQLPGFKANGKKLNVNSILEFRVQSFHQGQSNLSLLHQPPLFLCS